MLFMRVKKKNSVSGRAEFIVVIQSQDMNIKKTNMAMGEE